jgi:general nucleoside transport system permease protein
MDLTEIVNALTSILDPALIAATPIALGAYSGLFSERAGVVNIGIEGMMLIAALTSQLFAQYIASQWVGTVWEPYGLPIAALVGILTGILLGALHAVLSIRFKVNQIISGTVINIAAIGITGALYNLFLTGANVPVSAGTFPVISIPVLSDIPILGPVLFENQPVVFSMLILTVVAHYILFYTPWGLRTRAVGEHPRAADTLGIDVFKMRYLNVMLGGALAGLAGTWFTLEWVGVFNLQMTSGRGFIALAAMIFGRWTPFGAFIAAMIFGLAQVLQIRAQTSGLEIFLVEVPYQFLVMAPYILTMLVLAGFGGRARPPAADGIPYEK